jgi:hypothetical protein
LEQFEKSWIHKSIQNILSEKYQSLFSEAIATNDIQKRSNKMEQMIGVAYAIEALKILKNDIENKIREENE